MQIQIKNLTKKYGEKLALNNVSFDVAKGEILGFLGPNGAGKTTTMNIITGYILSTTGEAIVADGCKIGYLPEQPPLYHDMTVLEYLKFVQELKKANEPSVDSIMEMVQIDDVKNRLIKNLSKGYKQRIGLAQALVGNPEILILDEPTVGLDPKQIVEIRETIKNLAENHTIVVSSHIMQEIEALATRVIIINEGEIVANDTIKKLTKKGETLEQAFLRIIGADMEVNAI